MQTKLVLGYIIIFFFPLEGKRITKQQNVFFHMPQNPQNLLRQQIDIILTEISNICSLLGRGNTEPPLPNLYCSRAH